MVNRVDRELQSREKKSRDMTYVPPQQLPTPDPIDGYSFRWIRTALNGQDDVRNVSVRRREGWEPCRAEDHPELALSLDVGTKQTGNVEIGGLMLCKVPTEKAESRQAFYEDKANQQLSAVENNFMRENDPRMPLYSDKKTTTTFGKSN